jgi:hypothetical protein
VDVAADRIDGLGVGLREGQFEGRLRLVDGEPRGRCGRLDRGCDARSAQDCRGQDRKPGQHAHIDEQLRADGPPFGRSFWSLLSRLSTEQ